MYSGILLQAYSHLYSIKSFYSSAGMHSQESPKCIYMYISYQAMYRVFQKKSKQILQKWTSFDQNQKSYEWL